MKLVHLLFVFIVGAVSPVWSHFKVEPIKIQMQPGQKMVTLSITNQSKERRYIQVSTFMWDQKDSKDIETPSCDLLVFPLTLSLDPDEKKDIQVKSRNEAPQDVEKAYRILLQEIPQKENKVSNGITLLMNVKIAFYIKPQNRDATKMPECNIVKKDGKAVLECFNPNNEHVVFNQVHYQKDGKEETLGKGLAILAQQKKTIEINEIPDESLANCKVDFIANSQTFFVDANFISADENK